MRGGKTIAACILTPFIPVEGGGEVTVRGSGEPVILILTPD